VEIYLVQNGKETGPFPEEDVRAGLESGQFSPDTFATCQGMDEWKPLSEVLPGEPLPPKLAEELPPELPVAPASPSPEPDEAPQDPHEDEPDARRYTPDKEELYRSCAWLVVGLFFLLAFVWPTKLADGWGVLNFQFAWANNNLTWSVIPLMVWPGVAGLGMVAAGFLLRGRIRGVLAVLISLLPIVLILIVGGDGFIKMIEAFSALEAVDISDEASRNETIEKSFAGLRGLIGLGAAILLSLIILAGVLSTIYFSILLAPHATRHLRPNSTKAYYFGLIGGVFLMLFQLVGLFFCVFSFFGGILFGLGMVTGLALQITAVILGFTNTLRRHAKQAAKRALLALAFGVGSLLLISLTLLLVPLIEGGAQATIGMYIFKLFIWFTAAVLVFPLGVLDLWLGKAADTPQNS
jgi:hypothetical protein